MAAFESIGLDVAMRFLTAFGIGGLIGLERERHRGEQPVLAGVRTMPLVAVSGALTVVLAELTGSVHLYPAAVLVVGALAIAMLLREAAPGMTTAVTLLVTFLLGITAGLGELFLAVALGVAITFLLFYKDYLHRMADVLTEDEMRGTLYFAAVAFILYPLAPSEPVDPWGLIDVRRVLLIVVLVSALSFAGFIVLRRYGARRGLALTGMLGGLVSSVAATGAIANMARHDRGLTRPAAQGILLATTSMLGRNLAVAAIVDPGLSLATLLVLPLAGMALIMAIAVVARGLRDEARVGDDDPMSHIRNPFALGPALQFGLIFLGLSVLAQGTQAIPGLGGAAVYLTALGGLVSSGAVLASMGLLLVQGAIDVGTAASVGLVSVVVSLVVKGGIARRAGPGLAKAVWGPLGMALVVGLAAAVALV